MPFRFSKTIKLAPGVKFRINKRSTSLSVGGKHAGFTFSSRGGASFRASAPGTGISYRTKIGGNSVKRSSNKASAKHTVYGVQDVPQQAQPVILRPQPVKSVVEKPPPDKHRPDNPLSIIFSTALSIVLVSVAVLALSFGVFSDYIIPRVVLFVFLAVYIIGAVNYILHAHDVAAENRKYNDELDRQDTGSSGTP